MSFRNLLAYTKKLITAAANTTITSNPKTGMKFLSIYGDTYAIKDLLKFIGFRFFKGTWGMPVEMVKDKRKKAQDIRSADPTSVSDQDKEFLAKWTELEGHIDLSVIDSDQAVAEQPAPGVQTQPEGNQGKPEAELTQTDKTLAEMKKTIDEEMKGSSANEKAKKMLAFIDTMIDKVASSVDEAAKQDFVRSFLAFSAKFHNYSFSNQILIWVQRPDATYVSGFKQWMEKGRQVINWGRPIQIIRPQMNKRELTEEQAAARRMKGDIVGDNNEVKWLSFAPATVYDISDTQPIPGWKDKEGRGPFEVPSLKRSPNEEEEQITTLVKAAVMFSNSVGIKVDLEKELDENTGGVSKGKEIEVNKTYRGINQFSTWAHEMSHEILHREDDQKTPVKGESRQSKEIDSETAAYIILKHYGYDSLDAPNYIALWRGSGEDVKKRRNNISKAVKIIIDGIDRHMGKAIEAPEEEKLAWVRKNCKFARKG